MVVGARQGSLGWAVARQAQATGYVPVTAGLHDEDLTLDVCADDLPTLTEKLAAVRADHVVCTVGLNGVEPVGDPWDWYRWHFEVNVTGPMRLLLAWEAVITNATGHFVAVSSNSAQVPRSGSAAYCASKAALSMALRVKARERAATDRPPLVYGYEPGLLAGTPMTGETVERFGSGQLTRMRSPRLAGGMSPLGLAWMIVSNLSLGPEVNGCLFRVDADES